LGIQGGEQLNQLRDVDGARILLDVADAGLIDAQKHAELLLGPPFRFAQSPKVVPQLGGILQETVHKIEYMCFNP
jgi:hypothetical protein